MAEQYDRCLTCGKVYLKRGRARYCSDACRQRAYRIRHGHAPDRRQAARAAAVTKAGQAHDLNCWVCGADMRRDGNSASRAMYCSPACKQRAYRARRAGLVQRGVVYCRDCGQSVSLLLSGGQAPGVCAFCGADPAVWVIVPPVVQGRG